MPSMISFAMTTEQVRNRTKFVTRRMGWAHAKSGMVLWAVEKAQGLKRGEKVKRICLIKVVDARWEPLNHITPEECILEGFPEMRPIEFIEMFRKANRCQHDDHVRRIQFEYIDDQHV